MLKAIVDAEGKLTVEGEDKAIDALLGPGVAPRGPGITEVSLQLHSVEEASQVLTSMNSKHEMLLDLRPAAGSVAPPVLLQTGTSISEIGDLITKTMPGSALPKLLSDAVPAAAQSQSSNAAVESGPQSQESKPKPPAVPDQSGSTKRVSADDIGLSPVPPVPELIWKSLSPADKQTTAKQLVERAVEFATNRQVAAAWAPLSEGTALLAHLDSATRQDIALQILQQREQLTAEHVRAAQIGNDFQQERVRLMKEAVNTNSGDDQAPRRVANTLTSCRAIADCHHDVRQPAGACCPRSGETRQTQWP